MKRAFAALGAMPIVWTLVANAHPPAPASVVRRHPETPAPDLPMLPSVSRVRVEAARDGVLLVQDVDLPRGDWRSGSLDLYAAFGSPGPPRAVDARLVGAAAGKKDTRPGPGESAGPGTRDARSASPEREAGPSNVRSGPGRRAGAGATDRDTGPGERVETRASFRLAPGVSLLLGRPLMAGVVLHVRQDQLRRAYASSDHAVLRIRSLLPLPAADPAGARDVVVRLGIASGLPLTLGRIQVVSRDPAARIAAAQATLCGPEADPWPLSVGWSGAAFRQSSAGPPTLAPSAAVRHASDDLCIRWWTERTDRDGGLPPPAPLESGGAG